LDPQPVSTRRGLLVVLSGIGVGLLILMAITFVVIRSN
jgi:hypothetical protein